MKRNFLDRHSWIVLVMLFLAWIITMNESDASETIQIPATLSGIKLTSQEVQTLPVSKGKVLVYLSLPKDILPGDRVPESFLYTHLWEKQVDATSFMMGTPSAKQSFYAAWCELNKKGYVSPKKCMGGNTMPRTTLVHIPVATLEKERAHEILSALPLHKTSASATHHRRARIEVRRIPLLSVQWWK